MNKLITVATSALALGLAAPAFAQEEPKEIEISGSATIASDYRFRGVSQSNKGMAVQAGFTAKHQSGLYAGVWASNLAGWGTFGGSNTELDIYGGYTLPVGGATLDAGLTWYMYPGGSDKTDFAEPFVKLSGAVGPANLLVGVAYAPKQEALGPWSLTGANAQAVLAGGNYNKPGAKDDNLYIWADANTALPSTPVTLKAHLGYSDGNPGLGPNGTSVAPTGKYWDWSLGADVAVGPLTLNVSYIDTDITNAQGAYLQPNFSSTKDGSTIAGSTVVVSVTGSF
ncbi:hypothetical protein H7F51_11245 [Novosphingobium flavum]|uniref:Porin n=1 Tax=Novosphingobium flavum TaxID=1778672 RepID=A0A7X1FTA4_9SPHN|nr:TorF family putative porin [Novosphingobium flavum]MBC2666092.1 hypothetical protein [Novosphingobium flavum]